MEAVDRARAPGLVTLDFVACSPTVDTFTVLVCGGVWNLQGCTVLAFRVRIELILFHSFSGFLHDSTRTIHPRVNIMNVSYGAALRLCHVYQGDVLIDLGRPSLER